MKRSLSIFALTLLVSSEAIACSCRLKTLEKFVSNADSIYLATLQQATFIPGEYGRQWPSINAQFLVRQVLKGSVQQEKIMLTTGTGGGDCGVPMTVAETYIIFKEANATSISICDGSSTISGFEKEEISAKVLSIIKSHSSKRQKN